MNKDPQDEKDPLLLDHEYDGIKEYDNPMPRWWLGIFWVSVVWGVLYWLNVPGIGVGKGRIADFEQSVAEAEAKYGDLAAGVSNMSADEILAVAGDATRLEAGKETFIVTCSPCHKTDGGGSIGPNLTDAYWVHGRGMEQQLKVVSEGILEKGMPAWSAVLQPAQIAEVIAYVRTLEGTNPPDAKGPEGVNADSLEALEQTDSSE